MFLCLWDRCDEGIEYAREAIERDPDPPPWYRTALVVHALTEGNPRAALSAGRRMMEGSDDNDCTYVVAAAGLQGATRPSPRCTGVIARNRERTGDPLGGSRFWVRGPELLALLEDGIAKADL